MRRSDDRVKRTAWRVLLAASVAMFTTGGMAPSRAGDLVWEVENPFRFYKSARSFQLHDDAFKAGRDADSDAVPKDIVQRIERCLNDADSVAGPARAACVANANKRSRTPLRLGWAAATYEDACYDRSVRPRRYPANCARKFSFSREAQREDYVLPGAHTVSVRLGAERLAEAPTATCKWRWKSRAQTSDAWTERDVQSCGERLIIARVPYAEDKSSSGVTVEVMVSDGRTFAEDVVVDDVLVVALGDSFSSGEGNPDKPVTFSAVRAMDYRLAPMDPSMASMDGRGRGRVRRPELTFDDRKYDPYILPRRYLDDERSGTGEQYDPRTERFRQTFWAQSEVWLSPDCHRSQYAYPVRVGLQLALEDRHRAVTLVHLSCSGAEVTRGLFMPMEAREHYDASQAKTKMTPAQFEQLTNLLCRSAERIKASARLTLFEPGGSRGAVEVIPLAWCPPGQRKRDIDLVLLSIGGNDVGFGALAAYSFLESAGDIAGIVKAKEGKIRFGPQLADIYLQALDERLEAVKKAMEAGFGVKPARVIQTSYEPMQYDEDGKLCGSVAAGVTLGLDVHPKFRFSQVRLGEVGDFVGRMLVRLQCTAKTRAGCPQGLRTGQGTGFTLVTEHQPEFMRRGICARDPGDDGSRMRMPRIPIGSTDFAPTSPNDFRPYASRTRLFRTPNDAFLTAHTHAGSPVPLIDILQPAVAALYGGAFHPTAQAHALVADYIMPHARRIVGTGE